MLELRQYCLDLQTVDLKLRYLTMGNNNDSSSESSDIELIAVHLPPNDWNANLKTPKKYLKTKFCNPRHQHPKVLTNQDSERSVSFLLSDIKPIKFSSENINFSNVCKEEIIENKSVVSQPQPGMSNEFIKAETSKSHERKLGTKAKAIVQGARRPKKILRTDNPSSYSKNNINCPDIETITSDETHGLFQFQISSCDHLTPQKNSKIEFKMFIANEENEYNTFLCRFRLKYPIEISENSFVLIYKNKYAQKTNSIDVAYKLQVKQLCNFFMINQSSQFHPLISQVCDTVKIPVREVNELRTSFSRTKRIDFLSHRNKLLDIVLYGSGDGPANNTRSTDKSKESRKAVTPVKSKLTKIKAANRKNMSTPVAYTLEVFDPYEQTMNFKEITRGRTAIITNIEFSQHHKCMWDSNYPENPYRAECVLQKFKDYKLYDRCVILECRDATKEEILRGRGSSVFTYEYFDNLTQCNLSVDGYETISSKYDSIFINEHSFKAATTAAGCCIELIDAIMSKQVLNGFAVVRPPGHHAMSTEFNGYCFFNNAVISAEHAMYAHNLKRILIVDFDVHHGQGTQDRFYKSKNVLYFSIHRYEHGHFWPNLKRSDYDYTGTGEGAGFNINVPLNEVGMGDTEYLAIIDKILLPVAYEGEMKVTPQCYAHITYLLQLFGTGKVAVLLEGGYNPLSLSEGAAQTLRALLDDPLPKLPKMNSTPKISLLKTIQNVVGHLKQYWDCLKHYNLVTPSNLHPYTETNVGEQSKYETRNCYPSILKGCEGITQRLNILELITPYISSYLNLPPHKLIILYDEEMLKHTSRDVRNTPLECPARIQKSYELLQTFGILDRCLLMSGSRIDEEQLYTIHQPSYISKLKRVIESGNDEVFTSVYTNEHTLDCALMAAGSSLHLLHEIITGKSSTGLALIRPPGHHAEPDTAMGFCIFNNVALVAKSALDAYTLNRVLIIDFDIHHPNGTYSMFKSDKRCLLISIHRFHPNFFPHTGALEECGEGNGIGFNVNIPWTQKGQGDHEYISAFHRIIMPIARQFNPDLVLVSAGFDAAVGDPLGQCNVSPEVYGHMTHMLKELAGGKIIMFLEGGYNVTSVSHSVVMCAKALLGDPIPPVTVNYVLNDTSEDTLRNVTTFQQTYWPILKISCPLTAVNLLELTTTTNLMDSLSTSDTFIPLKTTYNTILECDHLDNHIQNIPPEGVDAFKKCDGCDYNGEFKFVCLTCYYVGCGEQIEGHTRAHAYLFSHPLIINLRDYSIYCVGCSKYLSTSNLYEFKNAFHLSKHKTAFIE